MQFKQTLTVLVCCITSSVLYSSDKTCFSRLLPTTYEHDQKNGVLIGRYTAFIGSDDNHNRGRAWQKILDHNPWHHWKYESSEVIIHKLYYVWRTYEVRAYLPKDDKNKGKDKEEGSGTSSSSSEEEADNRDKEKCRR